MKKIVFYILLVAVVTFCIWLVLHRPTLPPKQPSSLLQPQLSAPPEVGLQPITNASQQRAVQETNFQRPAGIDDEGWKYLKMIRQLALTANQPVEFYAHLVDQNNNPVEGAVLSITISRIDEKMFETTNFFHRKMGDEVVHLQLKLMSDTNGWIRITGMTGTALRVESLSKEGYSWTMPQIDSFAYEPNGKRTVGYAGMEDAFNPDKGYVFHLQKQ